ncbi:MAG: prepilin-type N-terminal cleavage/methylation domain-containing protein [Methylomonas sp.]|uniref:prepilin-type N-terminal cleavage/methylation domain-containing protein n=1 Tax=Methylomonas sp. TaxID=418 RepID=UPI0025E592D8|nr:prepilin-type N-terminal cleavage/methylation domain-containing protein [Methylomonas sp.]MCK9605655.1 prepilin-type N-terminal cleavage/methylation domain-containing protein [Methylomonas sp.]
MKPFRRNGFTLIEVLIAMTLLGVMVVLLFSSLRIAAESWNAGESKMAAVNQKAVVYQFFKRHLTAIRPLPMLNTEPSYSLDAVPAFQGFPQSLRFVAALPASSARKGLQLFSIALDPENSATLLVALTPYRVTEADQEPVKPEVLLESIAGLKFAYFGRIEEFAEPQWLEEWAAIESLPSLIKVSIALKDGSYWPDMIFPLKITRAANTQSVADDGQINEDTDQR